MWRVYMENNINLFQSAYFGKAYKTRDGRKALYFCQPTPNVAHRLFIEGTLTYTTYNDYGRAWITEGPDDIISEWEYEISEEEQDKMAQDFYDKEIFEYAEDSKEPYIKCYKAGLCKGLAHINNKK